MLFVLLLVADSSLLFIGFACYIVDWFLVCLLAFASACGFDFFVLLACLLLFALACFGLCLLLLLLALGCLCLLA